jgi:copper chaperone NosL
VTRARRWMAAAVLAVAAPGCATPRPRGIAVGSEPCSHCHMTIADPRYSGELVTRKGRVFAFDDIGCLVAFAHDAVPAADIHSLWVSDYLSPDSLLDASRAVFFRVDSIRTPMGSHLLAVRPGRGADSLRLALGGTELTWRDVWSLARERLGGAPPAES